MASPSSGTKRTSSFASFSTLSASSSSSSFNKRVKLDLPQDQRDALILGASSFLEFAIIPDFKSNESQWARMLLAFLRMFIPALESTDVKGKVLQPARVGKLLQNLDGQLEAWQRAFQKGVEEKDWMDLVGLCKCHFTPDAPVHRV
jgi:hypothetical protein